MLIDGLTMKEIVDIHVFVKEKLQSFKVRDLCFAFDVGKMFYNTTQTLNGDVKPLAVFLMVATFGIFPVAKQIKGEWRTPWQSEITEENKMDVLKAFLSTKGGKDLFSLKFLVIGQLFHIKTASNLEASMIVDEVMNQLKLTPVLNPVNNIELKPLR